MPQTAVHEKSKRWMRSMTNHPAMKMHYRGHNTESSLLVSDPQVYLLSHLQSSGSVFDWHAIKLCLRHALHLAYELGCHIGESFVVVLRDPIAGDSLIPVDQSWKQWKRNWHILDFWYIQVNFRLPGSHWPIDIVLYKWFLVILEFFILLTMRDYCSYNSRWMTVVSME